MVHILAAETLDFEMDRDAKRKTGIYKLTEKEKGELQKWIDTHFAKRDKPATESSQRTRSMLEENLHGGSYIRLANKTLWSVSPQDANIAQGWITPIDIIVTKSGDSEYPYHLLNTVTGSYVRAKPAQTVPHTLPPTPTQTQTQSSEPEIYSG